MLLSSRKRQSLSEWKSSRFALLIERLTAASLATLCWRAIVPGKRLANFVANSLGPTARRVLSRLRHQGIAQNTFPAVISLKEPEETFLPFELALNKTSVRWRQLLFALLFFILIFKEQRLLKIPLKHCTRRERVSRQNLCILLARLARRHTHTRSVGIIKKPIPRQPSTPGCLLDGEKVNHLWCGFKLVSLDAKG